MCQIKNNMIETQSLQEMPQPSSTLTSFGDTYGFHNYYAVQTSIHCLIVFLPVFPPHSSLVVVPKLVRSMFSISPFRRLLQPNKKHPLVNVYITMERSTIF